MRGINFPAYLIKGRILFMKIKKSQIREMIEKCKPYIHNSSVAVIKENEYIIYSYTTLMCVYDMEQKKVNYYNSEYYSRTTSYLQNIIKEVLF